MASNNIARLGVVLGLDTAEFTAAIDKAILENRKLKNAITKDSNAAAAEIVQLKYATEDYGKALTQVDLAQREISSGRFKNATSELKAQLLQQAAALDEVKKSTKGASAGMTAFQQQSLMYQTTDFFTQVASGQSVMIAAIQQGGQLKDTMGGLGPMFKMLAGLITPFRVAMVGLTAAVGTTAFALYKGHEEFTRLRDDLRLTGNFAGITHGQFALLADGISGNMVASIGEAKEVLSQLVASGNFTGATFSSVGDTILRFAKISGLSADEAAKKLMPALNGTAASAKSLNDQYHFLTMEQYLQIEALERQGKKQEAIILTSDALNASLKSVKVEVGYLSQAWQTVSEKASAAWNAMMNWGKPDTIEEKLKKQGEAIVSAMKVLEVRPNDLAAKAQFENASKAYKALAEERDASDKAAAEKSAAALKTQTEIELRAKAGGFSKEQANIQLLAKLQLDTKLAVDKQYANERMIIDLDAQRSIDAAKAEFKKKQTDEVGVYTAKNTEILNEQIAQIEQDRKTKIHKYAIGLMVKEAAFADELRDESIKAQVDALKLVSDRQLTSYNKFKVDKDSLQYDKDRLAVQEKMMFATDRELKQEMLRLDVAREIKAIEDSYLPDQEKSVEMKRIREKEAMKSLQIDAQDRLDRMKEFTSVVFSNMSTAIDNFVKTGKLNFKDFARSIIQDLIAIQLKAQAVTLLNMAFKAVGAFSVPSNASTIIPMQPGGGYADGGDPPVGQASWVGERGPEIFVPRTAGTIIPNHALAGMGGGGQTINYNGPFIQNMSAIDTQSGIQFLAQNKQTIWAVNQSAQRSLPMSR